MTTIMQIFVHIRGGVSLVISSVLAVGKHFRLGIILALACLACVLSYVPAVSQTYLPNLLLLGVRSFAYPIGYNVKEDSAEGFCGTFGKELQNQLASNGQQTKVKYIDIKNEGLGQTHPRYQGLKKRFVHIECGPNSRFPEGLSTAESIGFSDVFHETGVKILLKKQLAEDLRSGNKKLKEIKIGVVKETTTLKMLEQEKDVNKIGYDRWDQALNALEQNQVDAFASDTLIVLTLLNKGVNQEIKKGVNEQEKLLLYRDAYKNKNGGYTIYPESSYLIPSAKKEQYAMAFDETVPFKTPLLNVINQTLQRPEINQAKEELKKFENPEIPPTSPPSQTSPPSPTSSTSQTSPPSPLSTDKDQNFFLTILGGFIGLVGVLIEIYSETLPADKKIPFVKAFGLLLIILGFLLFVAMKLK